MDVVAARLTSQLLGGPPATSVAAVVDRLLALQAQDERGVRLAVRSRSTGLSAVDVDRALTEERSVVVSWLNRGTLHLVPAADWPWLHTLTAPRQVTGNRRRLAEEGVSPAQADRGVEVVMGAVHDEGPLTRDQLRARLDDAGVPTAGQALVHVLSAATIRHDLIRGPVVDGRQAFVAASDWLGAAPRSLDRDEALATLARRYLAGHGPATPRDLATWVGLPLGDARAGFAAIADDTEPTGDDGLVALRGAPAPAPLPTPRLLGPFDPILHGWASRQQFTGRHTGVVTTNGLFRATALVDGRVVATWGLDSGTLTLRPLEPIGERSLAALREDAADVGRFLGLDLVVAHP